MYRTYAGDVSALGGGIFADIGAGMDTITPFMGTILVVAVVGFAASLAGTESASAAGDDYPMAETLVIDGVGTCLGAIFGSFYGTTVYIGHPIHKTLGAKSGYSVFNGVIYFIVLWSGMFATIYKVIPGCANGALLIFVGLFMCRQAIEDVPPDYYPAIFFGLFPCLCNWAKLRIDPGVTWTLARILEQYGKGGWWAGGTRTRATGAGGHGHRDDGPGRRRVVHAHHNVDLLLLHGPQLQSRRHHVRHRDVPPAGHRHSDDLQRADVRQRRRLCPKMGPERVGYYPKKNKDTNFSWMWTVAFAMCTIFFLIQFALQRAGIIDPPIVREKPGGPSKAAVADAKTDIVEA